MKKIIFILLIIFSSGATSQEIFTVYFNFDESSLTQNENQKLLNWLAENNSIKITKIEGFCDWKGSYFYNDKLADRRINTVFQIINKIDTNLTNQVKTKSYGKRFVQDKAQYLNRKVLIHYTLLNENLKNKINNAVIGEKLILKNLYFYNRSGVFVPESIPVLKDLLQILKESNALEIEIQGHICCQINGDIENTALVRAKAVYDYLIENNISKERLRYKSFGSTMPIHKIPEENEQQRNENRRVEILILKN